MPRTARLDVATIFKVRGWERYRFHIDFEHRQAPQRSGACKSRRREPGAGCEACVRDASALVLFFNGSVIGR